jgi:hypothetical protein
MTLQEILEDVDGRVANVISTSQKVKWINQIQRQLFRDYPLPEGVRWFLTVPGLAFYELPEDCVEGRITHVVVGQKEYPYRESYEPSTQKFWNIVSGTLFLNPVPDDQYDVFVYYRRRPKDLSESDLNSVPNLPEDYHELLVLGCAKRVAQAQRDVELANNFEMDFRELVARAAKDLKKQRVERIRMVI